MKETAKVAGWYLLFAGVMLLVYTHLPITKAPITETPIMRLYKSEMIRSRKREGDMVLIGDSVVEKMPKLPKICEPGTRRGFQAVLRAVRNDRREFTTVVIVWGRGTIALKGLEAAEDESLELAEEARKRWPDADVFTIPPDTIIAIATEFPAEDNFHPNEEGIRKLMDEIDTMRHYM